MYPLKLFMLPVTWGALGAAHCPEFLLCLYVVYEVSSTEGNRITGKRVEDKLFLRLLFVLESAAFCCFVDYKTL